MDEPSRMRSRTCGSVSAERSEVVCVEHGRDVGMGLGGHGLAEDLGGPAAEFARYAADLVDERARHPRADLASAVAGVGGTRRETGLFDADDVAGIRDEAAGML